MSKLIGLRPAVLVVIALVTAMVAGILPHPAMAQNRTAIEALIAAQNPCASLKTTQLGFTIGIDNLKEVKVDLIDLSLRGDHVSVSLAGRLGCRTADAAMLKGDGVAAIRANASVILANCTVQSLSVALDQFGGTFAGILASARPQIEHSLAAEFRAALVDGCLRFKSAR